MFTYLPHQQSHLKDYLCFPCPPSLQLRLGYCMTISLQILVVLWTFMLSSSNILGLSLEIMHLQGAINDTFYTWLNPANRLWFTTD